MNLDGHPFVIYTVHCAMTVYFGIFMQTSVRKTLVMTTTFPIASWCSVVSILVFAIASRLSFSIIIRFLDSWLGCSHLLCDLLWLYILCKHSYSDRILGIFFKGLGAACINAPTFSLIRQKCRDSWTYTFFSNIFSNSITVFQNY